MSVHSALNRKLQSLRIRPSVIFVISALTLCNMQISAHEYYRTASNARKRALNHYVENVLKNYEHMNVVHRFCGKASAL